MNERWWGGANGIAFAVLQGVFVGIYASMGTLPSLADTASVAAFVTKNSTALITGTIVFAVSILLLYLWLFELRHTIQAAGEAHQGEALLSFGLGLVGGAFAILGFTLIGAAALDAGSATPEPTSVRALLMAGYAILRMSWLVWPLFLVVAASGTLGSGALPRWTGWLAYAAALLDVAAIPAFYGGVDPSVFYSVTGPASIVLNAVPFVVYVLATSVAMMRAPGR